jgi:hypothetical protein
MKFFTILVSAKDKSRGKDKRIELNKFAPFNKVMQ